MTAGRQDDRGPRCASDSALAPGNTFVLGNTPTTGTHPRRGGPGPVQAGRERRPSSRMSRSRAEAAACWAASGSEGAAVAMTSSTSATVTSARSSPAARARSTSRPTTSSSAAAPAVVHRRDHLLVLARGPLLHEPQLGRELGPLLRHPCPVRLGSVLRDADPEHLRRQQPSGTRGHRRPQEARERRPRFVLLAERGASLVGQPGSLFLGYPAHQDVLAREAPVHRADADPRAACDVFHRRAVSQLAEDLARRAQYVLQIALCVHAQRRRARSVSRTAAVAARRRADRTTRCDGGRGRPMRVLNVHKRSPGNDVSPRRLSPPLMAGACGTSLCTSPSYGLAERIPLHPVVTRT